MNEYLSKALQDATSYEEIIEMINDAPHVEGIEGVEFTPADLAGQYAFNAANDAGYGTDRQNIEGHLDFLVEGGAKFDYSAAIDRAEYIAAHTDDE